MKAFHAMKKEIRFGNNQAKATHVRKRRRERALFYLSILTSGSGTNVKKKLGTGQLRYTGR